MDCSAHLPFVGEGSQASESADGEICLAIQRLGGTTSWTVTIPAVSTLSDLRKTIAHAAGVGPFGFKIVTEDGTLLCGDAHTKVTELGLAAATMLTIIIDSARDYSMISGPEKVLKTGSYPAGLLINATGDLYVSHYSGELKVYNSSFDLVRQLQLPFGQPKQLTLGPDGELVIVFPTKIAVFDPISCELQRTFGDFSESRGIVVDGDLVYASDQLENIIKVFQLNDGKLLKTASPGLNQPCGMALVDEDLIAVADRGSNRVLLLNRGTLETESQLPSEGAPTYHWLSKPNDVKVDSGGNVLVMDTGNERIAVFRQEGAFVASVLKGFFKNHWNTFCNLSYNSVTGAIAASNDDAHCITIFSPIFGDTHTQ